MSAFLAEYLSESIGITAPDPRGRMLSSGTITNGMLGRERSMCPADVTAPLVRAHGTPRARRRPVRQWAIRQGWRGTPVRPVQPARARGFPTAAWVGPRRRTL